MLPETSSLKSSKDTEKDANEKEPVEYNPRWVGYVLIMLAGLLNFAAISSVPGEERKEYWIMSMAFGITTFLLSLAVLVQDRYQVFVTIFHYAKARDGYLEGYVLLAFVIWWLFGAAYITRPGGIAYVASNIYYSAWVSLFSSIYTLNEWSTEKDILSIAEITGISTTLRSWYVHFLSSFVVFSACIQLHYNLYAFDEIKDTSFGIAVGFVSLVMSLFYVFVHYDFCTQCQLKEGGWSEFFASLFLILVWTIGVSIFTRDGGIAATMEGSRCYRDPTVNGGNCTIVLYLTDTSGANSRLELDCEGLPRQVPGSNLYFASWCCLLSSINIALRWKAAQAMNFGRAREEREQQELAEKGDDSSSNGGEGISINQDDLDPNDI